MYSGFGVYLGSPVTLRYGSGSGQIWLDDLKCTGNETSLADCYNNGWGVHNCEHISDVLIACGNSKYSHHHSFLLTRF